MKLSNIRFLTAIIALIATILPSQARPEVPDSLAPPATTEIQPAVVVVHDTVYRYITLPQPAISDSVNVGGIYSSKYEKQRIRRQKVWNSLIPKQFTLQYAGSIGMLAAGPGWHYGRHHWETDLLFGFVPRYHSEKAKFTFTIKERYVPWDCRLSDTWALQPLTAGVAFSGISGDDFWKNLPDKYPSNYYWFSTKIRTHVYIGQRFRYDIPSHYRRFHSSVAAYYELSTCDFYALSKYSNREYSWKDVLSLAFGIRWEM